jgi:hypothetical protein
MKADVIPMTASKLPLILLLMATIVFVSVAPAKSQGLLPTLDLTTSLPCACSEAAVYTFHIENPGQTAANGITVTIPAGYQINPLYLTTTAGIVVATGVYGDVNPHSSGNTLVLETTTTSGIFQIIDNGTPDGLTGALTLPTQTQSGLWVIFTSVGPNIWVEVSFVAGFVINPCTVGTYNWSPNTANILRTITIEPRAGFSNTITITVCNPVGGVVAPTNKLEVVAPLAALAGLVVAVSAVVAVKKRRD